jgi:hypothetical protein
MYFPCTGVLGREDDEEKKRERERVLGWIGEAE